MNDGRTRSNSRNSRTNNRNNYNRSRTTAGREKTLLKEVVKEVKIVDEERISELERENKELRVLVKELKSKLIKEDDAKKFLTNVSDKVNKENDRNNKNQRKLNFGIATMTLGMLFIVIVTYLNDIFDNFSVFLGNAFVVIALFFEAFGLLIIFKSLLRK